MFKFAKYCILLILLAGCFCAQPNPFVPYEEKMFMGELTILTPRMNDVEKALIIDSIYVQLEEVRKNHGSIEPTTVHLFNGTSLPCESKIHKTDDGPIHLLTIGPHYEIPWLYHQLVHHVLGGDINHYDVRWPIWNNEQAKLIGEIRRNRAGIYFQFIKCYGGSE